MKKKKPVGHKKTQHTTSNLKIHKGVIEITRSGMGYVIVEALHKDILVRPQFFGTAFNGDTVEVEIIKQSGSGKTEGMINRVIRRKQTEFIGTIDHKNKNAYFIVDTDRPTPDFKIPTEYLKDAKDGEKVIVRMLKWDKKMKQPEGEVIEIIKAEQEIGRAHV